MTLAVPGFRRARVGTRRRRLTMMMRRGLTLETRVALALGALGALITIGVTLWPMAVPFTQPDASPAARAACSWGRARCPGS